MADNEASRNSFNMTQTSKFGGTAGSRNQATLQDRWNKSYADSLARKGPGGVKSGNLGTSFLVAPINHTSNRNVLSNFSKVNEFLQGRNEAYLKALNPDEEEAEAESTSKGSPGRGRAGGSLAARLKKRPSQIKTEYLQKLFATNDRGKAIHARELQSPHPSMAKKLNVDHFKSRNASVSGAGTGGMDRSFETEDEKFNMTAA